MNSLSSIVPGAMCAAGIVSGSKYGTFMLGLKIFNLFFLCGWLLINRYDLQSPKSAYMKLKFFLFQPLFFLLVLEFILELTHFSKLSTDSPVACCSVIFSQNDIDSLPVYQESWFILGLFTLCLVGYFAFGFLKKPLPFGIASITFAFSGIYALIRIFSPYIYQLPTHLCPFCMLQKEYFYIGYVIYILLFFGVLAPWWGLILYFIKKPVPPIFYKIGMIANGLLTLILLAYPLTYYIQNGVWL